MACKLRFLHLPSLPAYLKGIVEVILEVLVVLHFRRKFLVETSKAM
jgi:hypothetical protein